MNVTRVMPVQRPHRSKQDYATPREFLDAVQALFGSIAWDLAATHATNVVRDRQHAYFGPDNVHASLRDALGLVSWTEQLLGPGLRWLNPPFGSIAPWAQKCATESRRGAEILFLVPASVSANWFWDHVAPYAHVYALSPRLSFDGKNPFPKDLILAHYQGDKRHAPGCSMGFSRWRWKP